MENNDRSIDYWMEGVEFGQYRGRIIGAFFDLMDSEYQERVWVEECKERSRSPETSFSWNIEFSIELIFDELGMQKFLDKKEPPYGMIGGTLKTRAEAESLYKVAEYLDPLCECNTNQEFLSSPYLPKMREAAKEAFYVFMENEKDNKEFCNFIEELKKKEKRTW